MDESKALSVFQGSKIRKVWYNEEWWFVLEDIVFALTESNDTKQYINRMRQRDEEVSKGWVQFVRTLLIQTSGGMQQMNCANTEGAFRIIQSIPSPKAEPFKLWLAKVGYDRVREIEDPELAQKRIRETYKAKGYSGEWIEKRIRGIAIRDELTSEWKKRNVGVEKDFAILTAEISKATFGMNPSEYKRFKDLKEKNQNLRDHMNDLELIFTMLGEASTTKIARSKDMQGFIENKIVANQGGSIAGNALKELEQISGSKVSTNENYLTKKEKQKRLENKQKCQIN
ncbi:MAG: Bro-N domain-containing protein [Candidatus Diapherotrites archaeon]|nr:Bro-N domain-containing protein [Candidatus Diapherotrites archaeon]